MGYEIERRPGAWVTEQTRRRATLIGVVLGAAGVAALGITLYAAGHHRGAPTAGAALLIAVLAARRPAEKYIDRHARLRRGAQAEEAVGTTLERLRHEGWIVMHDLHTKPGANIDHLVSGPRGVFLIETKASRYDDRHVKRAKAQAAALHDDLKVWVQPVVVLHERGGRPFRYQGVQVVPHAELLSWLRAQHGKPVEFERLARFADRQ